MNAKRLAELRNVISTEVNPRDESDLLAILSDYEAALPLLEAAEELLEVAALRGDHELPHPADDPKPWSARMSTAWEDLRAALACRSTPRTDPKAGDVGQEEEKKNG